MPEIVTVTVTVITTATENNCGVEHRFTLDGTWNDAATEFTVAEGQPPGPCTWEIIETCMVDGASATRFEDGGVVTFVLD